MCRNIILPQPVRAGGTADYFHWRLEDLKQQAGRRFVSPVDLAGAAAGTGLNDEAMSWLERAYQDKDWRLVFVNSRLVYEDLRADPRFRDHLRRLRFPAE